MAWTNDILSSERLVLRCPTEADRPIVVEILTNPMVREFLGGPVPDEVFSRFRSRPIDDQWGLFVAALKGDGRAIGTFSIEHGRGETELSYELLPEFWGAGFAVEGCSALLKWAWIANDIDSIVAVTHSLNTRSLQLLDRLGFVADREFEEDGQALTQRRLRRPIESSKRVEASG